MTNTPPCNRETIMSRGAERQKDAIGCPEVRARAKHEQGAILVGSSMTHGVRYVPLANQISESILGRRMQDPDMLSPVGVDNSRGNKAIVAWSWRVLNMKRGKVAFASSDGVSDDADCTDRRTMRRFFIAGSTGKGRRHLPKTQMRVRLQVAQARVAESAMPPREFPRGRIRGQPKRHVRRVKNCTRDQNTIGGASDGLLNEEVLNETMVRHTVQPYCDSTGRRGTITVLCVRKGRGGLLLGSMG